MFTKDVKFEKSISINDEKIYFENKKEVVFVWRSNVWKSSLLNTIFWKKDLVKTSSKPWKTRTANIFLVNNKYYFTDLPGYGFAKLGKELKEDLDALISWYLEERKEYIKSVFILIDARLWISEKDIDMYKYSLELWLKMNIVISKSDKVNKSELNVRIKEAKDIFFWQEIIAVSSFKKIWLKELDKQIKSLFL